MKTIAILVALALAVRADVATAQADPADSLYRAATQAMNRQNYTRAAEQFERIVEQYPRSSYAPRSLYFRAFSLYRSGRDENLRTALATLSSLEERYPRSDLSDARTLRTRVCGELAQRGDAQCAAEVVGRARGVDSAASPGGTQRAQGASCSEDDDDERIAALNALLQMDAERAMPMLRRVLERRDECSYILRRKAVFLVSQKGGREAEDLLVQVARNDPDRETREQAIFWLGQVQSERAVDLLQDVLNNSTDVGMKDKAIFALSQHQSPRAAQILRSVAERENESVEVRDKAIFWLGQKRSEDNAAFLKSLYAKTPNEELKDKIIFSLSQQRGYGNGDWIMGIALDPKESIEMRKKALFWAGQNNGAPLDSLIRLYDRMSEPEMREQLIFVYSQRRDSRAVDKLMDIARNDKDREMRTKAVFWLSQSRDPRVPKFLEDLLNR